MASQCGKVISGPEIESLKAREERAGCHLEGGGGRGSMSGLQAENKQAGLDFDPGRTRT